MYTIEKLAELAEITPEYLAKIEKEKYSPSLVVIVKLALALNVPINKLIPIDWFWFLNMFEIKYFGEV